jgi:hypothetical protein
MIPPIYIALTLVAGLLLWFVIGARGKWWLKLPLIVLVPAFMFVVWHSLETFSGWPTTSKAPTTAYYVYGYVIEPDVNVHLVGAVYIWLVPGTTKHGALDYAPKAGEPRAYKLAYTRQLEKQVLGANQEVAHGHPVMFSSKHPGQRGTKPGKTGGAIRQTKGTYHFYDLRPQLPTRKGSQ